MTGASRLFRMLRYLRPAGGGLAAVSLATAGAYFVAVITAGHPLPHADKEASAYPRRSLASTTNFRSVL